MVEVTAKKQVSIPAHMNKNNLAGGELLGGSKLVLLEGSSGTLGSRRHHHSGGYTVNEIAPGGANEGAPGRIRVVTGNQTLSGLGSRRHHRSGTYTPSEIAPPTPVTDPPPRINNQTVSGLLGSRFHRNRVKYLSTPAKDGDLKIFETMFDSDRAVISDGDRPVIDPMAQKRIERQLLGASWANQWKNLFSRKLAEDDELRKKYLKTISNKKGLLSTVMPYKNFNPPGRPNLSNTGNATSGGYVVRKPIFEVDPKVAGKMYVDTGLLGESELEGMDEMELLGFSKTITVAMISPNPDSDLQLLGELYYMVENFHGDMFGSEELLGAYVIPELRPALSNLYVTKSGMLSGSEIEKMNDEELLGFFKAIGRFFKGVGKGIGKVAKGVWKGVKSAGKFVGKTVGKIAKGVGNVAKGIGKFAGKVGTGLWKGVKAAGKFVGNVVKTVGKTALDVGKFAVKQVGNVAKFIGKNALPILQAGLSFIPGGSIASGIIDLVSNSGSGNQEQEQQQYQQQEQYAPPIQQTQMSNDPNMYQQQYDPSVEYVDPSGGYVVDPNQSNQQYMNVDPSYFNVPPEEVLSDPGEYVELPQEDIQQIQQEYIDVSNDPNQEELTQGEMQELLGGLRDDLLGNVGKWIQKNILKPVTNFALNNPELLPISQRDMLYIGNKFQQGAQFKSLKNAVNTNAGMYADMQSKQMDSENKIGSNASNMLTTYALPIGIGLVALMLIMKK